ncbi:hypothetical protein K438DRAFT_1774675 [Mycena galopus ATCC 62051]|nr:hypothetical protein K438DRAFT_1774675 [Mycena galopus ATCC 62051]
MAFEDAAQLASACLTVCQSLYQCLRLPTPLEPASVPEDILIWSGTSATGQYAVQFAKLGGLRVISTSSEKNIGFVKSLGQMKFLITQIRGLPKEFLRSACRWGRTESKRKGVKTDPILVYSIFGKVGNYVSLLNQSSLNLSFKEIEFPFSFPGNKEHYENAKLYCQMVFELLRRDALKPIPVRIYPHGLSSVQAGFEDMKAGKITYRIADTPTSGTYVVFT